MKKAKCVVIKESSTKGIKVQKLAEVLKLKLPETPIRISKSKIKTVKPLSELAVNVISKSVTKHQLNVAYAEYIWPERYSAWIHKSPVGMNTTVNNADYNWFYIPEFSEKRQQFEVKCIDSTHLLTRTRRKSCKGGLDGVTNESWKKVAKSRKTMLTPIMVDEITDPMSVSMAITHFSESVEEVMRLNHDEKSADLYRDIRSWWDSEDRPGIPAKERIMLRTGLRKRLLNKYDFGTFPPATGYVYGWPAQLWEALLASMDANVLLYALCQGGTYNVRAFSSMIGETFFSELTLNDKRGQGTVSCQEFGEFIGNTAEQVQMRLDPERTFTYCTTRSTMYRLVEDVDFPDGHDASGTSYQRPPFRSIPRNIRTDDHMFDCVERRRLPGRKREGTVSTSRNALQKGALGVRWESARRNESKMLLAKKMGLE